MFRQRYLSVHDVCLNGLGDLIATAYDGGRPARDQCAKMLLILAPHTDPGIKLNDPEDFESPYFRNLRNAWYHEFAMRRSGLETAAWKIVKAYYAVFCSVSAVVRTLRGSGLRGHRPMLLAYGEEFVRNARRRQFLLPPSNLFLIDRLEGSDAITWPYGLQYKVPNVESGLRWARDWATKVYGIPERAPVTLPWYLLGLREWVNYSDAYLFLMLYGESIKNKLEAALNNIYKSLPCSN